MYLTLLNEYVTTLQRFMKHFSQSTLSFLFYQLTELIHVIVQTPPIPHDDRWNSSSSETLLFPS